MSKLSGFQQLLAAFIVFILGMIVCRVLYSGSDRFIFLLWNLFLAWIPFRVSLLLYSHKYIGKWASFFWAGVWLLFFPNALYIITDLIHLEEKTNVPIWYDAVLLFTSAIAGLLLAFASLYKAEQFFRRQFGYGTSNILIVLCLFMGSFGVYLGRFLRWNSWDIIISPMKLAREIAVRFLFPFEYYQTWAISLLFTSFFSLLYFTVKKLTIYGPSPNRESALTEI